MFFALAPVLYFAPSIINQVAIYNDDGLVVSQATNNKTKRSLSIKALIDKLFIPIGTEAATNYEKEKETQVTTQYDELSRAIQAVKKVQEETICVSGIPQISESDLNALTLVDGEFTLITKKSELDEKIYILVECGFGDYTIKGLTSVENWTSKSLINQLIIHGKLTASALVFPLSITKKTIEAKFACIFVL